ncbi:hypothetical protein AVEN_154620-1 [Araneus ventricosus]|uniref:Uncharacterized protein n=1 Tax=Araneus ventricosus TaxID=182803 RepID=A0A4Y2JWT4_ARAVE|nr:hypothetical protein AVEN_154620-1 [Araneus ventricosus]
MDSNVNLPDEAVYSLNIFVQPHILYRNDQSSSENLPSFSILALSFNSHRPPTGGTVQKASPQIPVNSEGGVHLSEPLLAPYLFGPFLLSQAASQDGDKLLFQSLPLKSSPLKPDWTPGSLCRRFNELRHLLCSVTHGVGKKVTGR